MRWFHTVRARLRLLAPRAEQRIDDEIRFHIEMETERLVRDEHLDRDQARRRALVTFGGVQQHRETLSDGRGTAWFAGLSLDFKLGVRMLVKYPGLTIVGGLAMTFGIWFGAITFQMFGAITSTKLPLPDGDRIIRIQSWDLKASREEDRVSYDLQRWRAARSLTDLGAYRDASVNLVGADSAAQPQRAAEITAAAFHIASARPSLGRVLTASDEAVGAPPVVVLGHDVWISRFNGDEQIVGRTVKVGNGFATVVGVMPEGFAFPVAHELWLPLRAYAAATPREGPAIKVFARLADGVSRATAQAELEAINERLAVEHSATHAQVQAYVLPYAQLGVNNGDMLGMMGLSYFFVVILMVVVCGTVGLLFFARAASRESELLVRSALGASRRRIVVQLFAEALVLAGVSAVLGLALAQLALTRLGRPYIEMNYGTLPFWLDFNLSPTTVVAVLGLAVLGAAVAGVMPARRITRGLGTRLRSGTAGGGVRFGGVWTAVIVTQVALTVALPAVVMLVRSEGNRVESYDPGFATREYLAATLGFDGPVDETMTIDARAEIENRNAAALAVLRQRLEAEPGITGVTFADALPAEDHGSLRVEVMSLSGIEPRWVSAARVDPSYFDVLEAPVLSGRSFTTADLSSDARVAVVDQAFIDLVMRGQNPVGQRVRLSARGDADAIRSELPWYQIVGVVKDLGMSSAAMPQRVPGLYLPTEPGREGSDKLIVHTRGDPLSLASRVRALAAAVDGTLRVEEVTRLDRVTAPVLWLTNLWARIVSGLTAVALLLSLAGVYSVLAYIVARRRREIGVRVALGASPRRVITAMFARPLTQVAAGVVVGSVLIFGASIGIANTEQFRGSGIGGAFSPGEVAKLAAYAAVMLGICTLACVVPTIRALCVQPTEAMRGE